MKLSLLIILLLLLFSTFNFTSAAEINDWVKFASSKNGANFFIDKNSIKKSESTRFFSWIIDLPKPIDGVLSLNEYQEVDCISKRFKVLRRKAFTDSLGEGSEHVTTSFSNFATTLGFVLKEKQEDEWEIAGSKTVNAAAIEYVCKGQTKYWIDIWIDGLRDLVN